VVQVRYGPDAQPAHQDSLCHKQVGECLNPAASIILRSIVFAHCPVVNVNHFTVGHTSLRIARSLGIHLITKMAEVSKITMRLR
jgi:hypothetical protein